MKSILKIIAIVLLTGNIAMADGPDDAEKAKLKVQVIEHKDYIFALHYATAEEGIVRVRIKSLEEHITVFFDGSAKHKLVVKKYDLSHLPAGKYIIEVEFDDQVVEKTIELK